MTGYQNYFRKPPPPNPAASFIDSLQRQIQQPISGLDAAKILGSYASEDPENYIKLLRVYSALNRSVLAAQACDALDWTWAR
jgi:hypothetical protein